MGYNRDLYLEVFLLSLFRIFDDNNIDFLILRNYKDLPKHLRDGGDIDFVLSDSSVSRIYDTLSHMSDLNILVYSKKTVVQEFIVQYKTNLFVKLDFHPFEDWHGAVYLKSCDIFETAQPYRMFRVPSDFYQALTMLMASYLYGAFIKKKYMDFAKPILANNEQIQKFIPQFGKMNVEAIQNFSRGLISENELLKKRHSMLLNLFIYNFKQDGICFLSRFIKTRIEEFVFRVHYKGLIIKLATADNECAIKKLRCFLESFLGEDRLVVLNGKASLKSVLKSWDDVARLRFVVYNRCNSIFLRKPNIVITDENTICNTVTNYLIQRNKKEM